MICVLPYLGKASLNLRTKLRRTIEESLSPCKLKLIFRSKCRLNTLFRFKDSFKKKISSGIIYHYTCSNLKVTFDWKTFRHFYTREAEHMGIFNLTEKSIIYRKNSYVPCLLLIVTLRFICGKRKIWSNIKMSQSITTMVVD